jgi:hypothetical protein
MVHYLVFDTETDLPAPYHGADVPGGAEGMDETNVGSYSNAQVDFIKQDLASVDRSKTPWVVALGHRPWYVAATPSNLWGDGQAVFEPLFTEGNVSRDETAFADAPGRRRHPRAQVSADNCASADPLSHLLSRTYPVWQNGMIQQTNYTEPKAPGESLRRSALN